MDLIKLEQPDLKLPKSVVFTFVFTFFLSLKKKSLTNICFMSQLVFASDKSFHTSGFELHWILSTPISNVPGTSNRYTLLNIYRSPWLWRPRSGKIPNKSIGHIHSRRWLFQFLNVFIKKKQRLWRMPFAVCCSLFMFRHSTPLCLKLCRFKLLKG